MQTRLAVGRPEYEFDEKRHKYFLDGEEHVSVTTVINDTVPKNFAWWGMQVGCNGVAELLSSDDQSLVSEVLYADGDRLVELLKFNRLTVNHKMRQGGERGKYLHKMLEHWARTGTILEDSNMKPYYRGKVSALQAFLRDNEPDITEYETRTGSREHRYAGTFDAKCVFGKGEFAGCRALLDLKTGKRVYADQYFPQLEAYEQAEVESGERATDVRLVLHLTEESTYHLSPSTDTFADFKVLLDHYRSIQARKKRTRLTRSELEELMADAE